MLRLRRDDAAPPVERPPSCAAAAPAADERLADQAGKREHAEAVADAAERLAASDRLRILDDVMPASVHEQELVRAQQHLHVAAERRRPAAASSARRLAPGAGHDAGHHAVARRRRARRPSRRPAGAAALPSCLGVLVRRRLRASALRSSYCLQRLGSCRNVERRPSSLRGRRRAAEDRADTPSRSARASSGSSATRSREPLGLLLHEVAVHEEQPLQRHVGREALLGGDGSGSGSRTAAGTRRACSG